MESKSDMGSGFDMLSCVKPVGYGTGDHRGELERADGHRQPKEWIFKVWPKLGCFQIEVHHGAPRRISILMKTNLKSKGWNGNSKVQPEVTRSFQTWRWGASCSRCQGSSVPDNGFYHKKVRFAREKGSSHQAKMWIWAWKLGFLHEKLGVGYQKNVFFQETLERVLYFHLVQLFRKIVHIVHLLIRIVFAQYFWVHICALMFVLPFLHVAVLLYFYLI